MSAHDTTHLQELGRRRKKLMAQVAALEEELTPEIIAAAQANVKQVLIMEWTGMSRETVRRNSMTPERREAERAKRFGRAPEAEPAPEAV